MFVTTIQRLVIIFGVVVPTVGELKGPKGGKKGIFYAPGATCRGHYVFTNVRTSVRTSVQTFVKLFSETIKKGMT